jgi:hypothetical protein
MLKQVQHDEKTLSPIKSTLQKFLIPKSKIPIPKSKQWRCLRPGFTLQILALAPARWPVRAAGFPLQSLTRPGLKAEKLQVKEKQTANSKLPTEQWPVRPLPDTPSCSQLRTNQFSRSIARIASCVLIINLAASALSQHILPRPLLPIPTSLKPFLFTCLMVNSAGESHSGKSVSLAATLQLISLMLGLSDSVVIEYITGIQADCPLLRSVTTHAIFSMCKIVDWFTL